MDNKMTKNDILLPCPFCGSEAEITDESQPDSPKSWFFAWCKNRPECNCWLAGGSPEKATAKWNRRTPQAQAIRAEIEKMIACTNIPLNQAKIRTKAICDVLDLIDSKLK